MKESYLSIFLTFLKFGTLAWGGPVAQIAMIREELVERKQWITPEKFQRVLAIYQALPGPEAHELCVYFGMTRRGRPGGFLAGLGFMMPGLLLILLLAAAYDAFGAKALLPFFVGVAPAVTALIARALHHLGGKILINRRLFCLAVAAGVMTLLHVHFLIVFMVAAIAQFAWARYGTYAGYIAMCVLSLLSVLAFIQHEAVPVAVSGEGALFWDGLKAGLLSFGGAYTAIPFLRDSMVDVYPAITHEAFLDSIALSNVVPAPLVIFGTFLGYLAGGLGGALLITAGIFLPAFSFTLLGHRYIEKAIENPAFHGVLDAIAASVIGLLFVTLVEIALHTLTGPLSLAIFLLALAGLYCIRWKWVVPLVILTCGVAGYGVSLFL